MNAQPHRPVWVNGWVFIYELSGCGFKTCCSHLNFRYCACFEQGFPWHSGNCRVCIHSKMRMWHDKNTYAFLWLTSLFILVHKKTKKKFVSIRNNSLLNLHYRSHSATTALLRRIHFKYFLKVWNLESMLSIFWKPGGYWHLKSVGQV